MKRSPKLFNANQAVRHYGFTRHFLRHLVDGGRVTPMKHGHGLIVYPKAELDVAMWDYIFSLGAYKMCRIHLDDRPPAEIAREERIAVWVVLEVKRTQYAEHVWSLVDFYLKNGKRKTRGFIGFPFMENKRSKDAKTLEQADET